MFNNALLINGPATPNVNAFYKEVDYTGNGSAAHAITGVGFQPDLVCPYQNDGGNFFQIFEAGASRAGYFSLGSTGGTLSNYITSFDSDGFTLAVDSGGAGSNVNAKQYRSFDFKKIAKGMDIVDYTGNGAARTIAHSLAAAPALMFVKRTDSAGNMAMYHSLMDATTPQHYELDWASSTVTKNADSSVWNDAAPTSAVFSLGIDNNNLVNVNAASYRAILFGAGTNRCVTGTYTGNGSSSGPSVSIGITPSLVMIFKQAASGNNVRWVYANALSTVLNNNVTEDSTNYIDLVSGGFNVKTTNADFNTNAATYVYTAWL